jgi:hypothetical protein
MIPANDAISHTSQSSAILGTSRINTTSNIEIVSSKKGEILSFHGAGHLKRLVHPGALSQLAGNVLSQFRTMEKNGHPADGA